VLLGWIPAALFLYFHGRTRWYERPAGQAVFVMAVALFVAMTMAMLTRTFGIELPEWARALGYGLILVALWWKLATILHYEYGNPKRATSTLNPGTRLLDSEETR
jgi:hypothetical protein